MSRPVTTISHSLLRRPAWQETGAKSPSIDRAQAPAGLPRETREPAWPGLAPLSAIPARFSADKWSPRHPCRAARVKSRLTLTVVFHHCDNAQKTKRAGGWAGWARRMGVSVGCTRVFREVRGHGHSTTETNCLWAILDWCVVFRSSPKRSPCCPQPKAFRLCWELKGVWQLSHPEQDELVCHPT